MQITVNGQPRRIAEGTSIAQLLDALELGGKHVAVEVNLQLVPHGRHAQHQINDGDQVEIVTLVGGG